MPLSPTTLDAASHGTLGRADYTYDREADCFVVTDENGDEICRTKSPHTNSDKTLVSFIVSVINQGQVIFPQLKEATK